MFTFFFFNDTATTEIYTLSLHDALPIWKRQRRWLLRFLRRVKPQNSTPRDSSGCVPLTLDRKSTRLNSSHGYISYAVFCLKKKTMTALTLRGQPPVYLLVVALQSRV